MYQALFNLFNHSGLSKKVVGLFADYMGVPATPATDKRLQSIRAALNSYIASLTGAYQSYYQEYVDQVATYELPKLKVYKSIDQIPTAAVEALVRVLSDNKTQFSQYLLNYSPYSTALKKISAKWEEMNKALESAQSDLESKIKANEEIDRTNKANLEAVEEFNTKEQARVDEINKQRDDAVNAANQQGRQKAKEAREKAESHNRKIESDLASAQSLIETINDLQNTSNYNKVSDEYKRRVDQVAEAANALVSQPKEAYQ